MELPRRGGQCPVKPRMRILIVASDPAEVVTVRGQLRRSPVLESETVASPSLSEAVEMAQAELFDAVVLVLGRSDARNEARRLLPALPDIPVVVMSQDSPWAWHRITEQLAVADFISWGSVAGNDNGSDLLSRSLVGAVHGHKLCRLDQQMTRTLDDVTGILDEGLLVVRGDGSVSLANRAAARLLGRHAEDIQRAGFPHDVTSREPYEIRACGADGQQRIIEVTSTPGSWKGEPCYLVKLRPASTPEVRRSPERDRHQPDGLTGLAGRENFTARIDDLMAEHRVGVPAPVALLLIDLDQFGKVNRAHGHAVGDRTLQQAAARISAVLPPGSALARLGGDEFGAALRTGGADALEVARHVADALSQPYLVDGQTVRCTATVGVAEHHDGCRTARDLLEQAENAVSVGPESADKVRVLDPVSMMRGMQMLRLRAELRSAVDEGDLWMVYQPIVSLSRGGDTHIVGLEALCRWEHPDHGLISPLEFIRVAEESGLIVPLGNWVLKEVCGQIRTWRDDNPALCVPPVSVNVSARQLAEPGLAAAVQAALRSNKLEPSAIKLEVTESAIAESSGGTREALEELACSGIEVQLDDFGTGYSSLTHLRQFPISTIKIDRNFVAALPEDPRTREIVGAMVAMGSSLGIGCIAKGVEIPSQQDALVELGCTSAQGYLFDVPLPAALVVERFATASTPRSRRLGLVPA